MNQRGNSVLNGTLSLSHQTARSRRVSVNQEIKVVLWPVFPEPLYTGAKLTVLDSYLLLYQFFLRHSLSKKAFSELITLISVHLPETTSQNAARSLYQLRQLFVTQFSDLIASPERYCSKCHFLYENDADDCPHGCGQPFQRFWVVSIAAQIKRMLEG